MDIQAWLESIPPMAVYSLVTAVILVETLGIPLPGEIVLVSAALLSAQGIVDPFWVGACASFGAVVGDSAGYAIGRRGGRPLLAWFGRRFPKHFSPENVALAERSFEKWGAWAVFFGRFVALLRIFSGPLSGVLRMPYWKFMLANVPGGILWAGGTTAVIYYLGIVAEEWLKRFSWAGLVFAALVGIASIVAIRRRAKRAGRGASDGKPGSGGEPAEEEAALPATAAPAE